MNGDSLFFEEEKANRRKFLPLSVRMRPRTLDDFVGQPEIVGEGTLLRRAITADKVSSLVLFGPPGTGKTTLATIIANHTKGHFERINAVTSSVHDVRKIIFSARERKTSLGKKTILFVDELHRFNRAQQDAFMEDVEDGNIILIGATTHNPFFALTAPLLSRSQVVELKPLGRDALARILKQALGDPVNGLAGRPLRLSRGALEHLVLAASGDARRALNALELAVSTTPAGADGVIRITSRIAEAVTARKVIRYDRDEDEHYDFISAFIKSVRGSDPDAAVYYLARMLEAGEEPRFIARRLVILASEDIGNAEPSALPLAVAAMQAVEFIGLPEGRLTLAQATVFLACAPKSNAACLAISRAEQDVREKPLLPVPDHLREGGYRGAKKLGRGVGYLYPHDFPSHYAVQSYLAEPRRYYTPSGEGREAEIARRLAELAGLRETFTGKARLRQKWLALRERMPAEKAALLSERIGKCLVRDPDFQKAGTIAFYAAFRNEVQTAGPMEKALAAGKTVCLPRVDRVGRTISFYRIAALSDLAPGPSGIFEPGPGCPLVPPERIDLVIVPGVAFDESGNRIGFGGGYYDRFLAALPARTLRLAIAYDFQVLRQKLPGLPKDVKIGKIITEEKIVTAGSFRPD